MNDKLMNGRVLVIDDVEHWRDDLRLWLERADFYVDTARDLQEALEKMQKNNYHFVTIDMQLDENTIFEENMEGWTILDKVKKINLHSLAPTMIITSFSETYLKLKGVKKVESIFLMSKKGFDPDLFVKRVSDAVKRYDTRFKDDGRGD